MISIGWFEIKRRQIFFKNIIKKIFEIQSAQGSSGVDEFLK